MICKEILLVMGLNTLRFYLFPDATLRNILQARSSYIASTGPTGLN
jgi:hypothetical protein